LAWLRNVWLSSQESQLLPTKCAEACAFNSTNICAECRITYAKQEYLHCDKKLARLLIDFGVLSHVLCITDDDC